jgi:hypothetical protein
MATSAPTLTGDGKDDAWQPACEPRRRPLPDFGAHHRHPAAPPWHGQRASPGMSALVEIKTGQKTVLEYLLRPVASPHRHCASVGLNPPPPGEAIQPNLSPTRERKSMSGIIGIHPRTPCTACCKACKACSNWLSGHHRCGLVVHGRQGHTPSHHVCTATAVRKARPPGCNNCAKVLWHSPLASRP